MSTDARYNTQDDINNTDITVKSSKDVLRPLLNNLVVKIKDSQLDEVAKDLLKSIDDFLNGRQTESQLVTEMDQFLRLRLPLVVSDSSINRIEKTRQACKEIEQECQKILDVIENQVASRLSHCSERDMGPLLCLFFICIIIGGLLISNQPALGIAFLLVALCCLLVIGTWFFQRAVSSCRKQPLQHADYHSTSTVFEERNPQRNDIEDRSASAADAVSIFS